MTNTVGHKELENWWDGRVIIDELKEFVDARGSLTELWRNDDDKAKVTEKDETNSSFYEPCMSYWSETKPFVQRGPHEHVGQTDVFVTWKARMIYNLYNPVTKEMKYFVTDPTKIYRVKVGIGIIHSYRNIGFSDSLTGNFPTSLFMGLDKKGWKDGQKVDEIRHEEEVKPEITYWLLGAGGRLGNSFLKSLHKKMGYHTFNVIPLFDKFANNKEGYDKLNVLLEEIKKTKNSVIINCVAYTNTADTGSALHNACNTSLPTYLTSFAALENVPLIHFSTDYVYQTGALNAYTQSKMRYESWLKDSISSSHIAEFKAAKEAEIQDMENSSMDEITIEAYRTKFEEVVSTLEKNKADIEKNVRILRVANLFSVDTKEDMFDKIYAKIKDGSIRVPFKKWSTLPTSTDDLADWVVSDVLNSFDKFNVFTNVSGKQYTMEQVVKDLFKSNIPIIETNNALVDLNHTAFISDNAVIINCEKSIQQKISKITAHE